MVLAPRAIALMFPSSDMIGAMVKDEDEKKATSLDSESDNKGFEKTPRACAMLDDIFHQW